MSVMTVTADRDELEAFVRRVVDLFCRLSEAMPAEGSSPWAELRAGQRFNNRLSSLDSTLEKIGQPDCFTDFGEGAACLSFEWQGEQPSFILSVWFRRGERPPVPLDYAEQIYRKLRERFGQGKVDLELFDALCQFRNN